MTDFLLATVAFLTAVNGLFGKTTEDYDDKTPKSLIRRIRWPGWTFLSLSVLTFSLVTYKLETSFDAHMHSAYPKFGEVVEQKTGHSLDDWEKYMSYRVTLRFKLQQLYSKVFPNQRRPESMKTTLQHLGESGAIPRELCAPLDYIRWYTYYVEWGTIGPSPQILSRVKKKAEDVLPKLARITDSTNPNELQADKESPCGTDVCDPDDPTCRDSRQETPHAD